MQEDEEQHELYLTLSAPKVTPFKNEGTKVNGEDELGSESLPSV